ncbi:MAG: Hsp20/alpha crystallin family protein [Acidobacteriota bacterium]|jgi:HSP20 family protein
MENVQKALDDVKMLYQEFVGRPAPEIAPAEYTSFPPGVDPIRHAVEEIDQLKRLSRQVAVAPHPTAWAPPADTFTGPGGMVIHLEIPGVAREDLKVFVVQGECVVRGDRRPTAGESELRPLCLERPWGSFERRFLLPSGTAPEKVQARYRDGILELRIGGDGDGIPGEMTVDVE